MSKYKGEKVLVVPRRVLENIGNFNGIKTDELEYSVQQILGEGNEFYMDRDIAESDPTHKQIIPYCVFICGEKILNYTRGKSGGESRLHAKISVGVGGHINPLPEGSSDFSDPYVESLYREVHEELEGIESDPVNHIIGILNDDINEVGQVHLGIVHIIELFSEDVKSREDCLSNLTFTHIDELRGPLFDRLETWSQYVIEYLAVN